MKNLKINTKNQKVVFIEARRKFSKKESINLSGLDKLPGEIISLAATVQYLDLVLIVKKYLETSKKNPKKVLIQQGAYHKSHVLGCQSQAFNPNADCFLLLTDGRFHAINNAIQLNKELYVYSVVNNQLDKITNNDLKKYHQKTQGKITKFLMSNKIGILVSTKSGQFYKNLENLKKKIQNKYKSKKLYVFETDSINLSELENFDIPIYINTACYGLALDSPKIINYTDLLEFL